MDQTNDPGEGRAERPPRLADRSLLPSSGPGFEAGGDVPRARARDPARRPVWFRNEIDWTVWPDERCGADTRVSGKRGFESRRAAHRSRGAGVRFPSSSSVRRRGRYTGARANSWVLRGLHYLLHSSAAAHGLALNSGHPERAAAAGLETTTPMDLLEIQTNPIRRPSESRGSGQRPVSRSRLVGVLPADVPARSHRTTGFRLSKSTQPSTPALVLRPGGARRVTGFCATGSSLDRFKPNGRRL